MLQFSAVAFVLSVEVISFWTVPSLIENEYISGVVGDSVITISVVITCAANPYLYFTLSQEVRKKLKSSGADKVIEISLRMISFAQK